MDTAFVAFTALACLVVILLVCCIVSGCPNCGEEKNLTDGVDLENSQWEHKMFQV